MIDDHPDVTHSCLMRVWFLLVGAWGKCSIVTAMAS